LRYRDGSLDVDRVTGQGRDHCHKRGLTFAPSIDSNLD
jgi:hypothetical protein